MNLRKLLPYKWPSDNPWLQLRVIFCVLLLIAVRVINVFVPIYYEKIVDAFDATDDENQEKQKVGHGGLFVIWISLKLLQGGGVGGGHLSRKTGEVLRIMDRGTSSINSLVQYLVFNIIPTLIDIVIAIVFFSVAFNFWFGLIILIAITEWRTKFRREMNLMERRMSREPREWILS